MCVCARLYCFVFFRPGCTRGIYPRVSCADRSMGADIVIFYAPRRLPPGGGFYWLMESAVLFNENTLCVIYLCEK